MNRRSWLWRRKSSDKSLAETESSESMSSHSERFFDDQVGNGITVAIDYFFFLSFPSFSFLSFCFRASCYIPFNIPFSVHDSSYFDNISLHHYLCYFGGKITNSEVLLNMFLVIVSLSENDSL